MADLGPFPLGMNNRAEDHDLPEGSVRNLVNADVSDSGKVSRRKGFGTKVYSGLNCRAGFDSPIGEFFVEGSDLMKLNADNTATVIAAGIVLGASCTFEYNDGIVYFSDGLTTRKIYSDFTVTKWGMDIPGTPILSNVSGSYNEGVYTAAVTFVDFNGVESGASAYAQTRIRSAGRGIKFSNLPTTSDPQVAALRLYLSMPDGSVLFYIAQVALGTTTYTIMSGTYDDSRYLETENVSKPPPGIIIRYHAGRMFIVDATGLVWYTDSYALDHVKLSENYLHFPNAIKIFEPVDDGIYIADNYRTDFYSGRDPKGFNRLDVFPNYGGIMGTGRKIPDSKEVAWMSQRGAIIAGPGGQAKNIQEKNVATESALSGATLIREEDGVRQFIASIHDTTTSTLACRSFIDTEIIRKGA